MFKQNCSIRFMQPVLLLGFLLFLLLPQVKASVSQNDLPAGKTLLKKAQKLNQHRQPDQAYLASTEAARLLKQNSPEDYMLARLEQAHALLQMSAVFSCFKQMEENEAYLKKHFKPSDKIYVRFNQLKGELHFTNREVEEALEVWYSAKNLALKHYGSNSIEYAARLTDIGKCYVAGSRLDSSFKYISQAMGIVQKQPRRFQDPVVPMIYYYYGLHFTDHTYYQTVQQNHEVVHNGKKYPARSFVKKAYLDSAVVAAKNIFGHTNPTVSKLMVEQYLAIAELFIYTKPRDPAKALQIGKLGRAYSDTVIAILQANKQPELAYFYHLMGMRDLSENKLESGEDYYLKALQFTLPTYKGTSLNEVPEIRQVFAENHLGVNLEAITYYFIGKYRQTGDVKFLETANQYAQRSLQLADYIRHKKAIVSHGKDKPGLLFQSWNYGMAIETAYLLYEKTGNPKYKNQAFRDLEKIKSLNLVQAALNDKLAHKVTGFKEWNKRYKDLSARVLRKQEQTHIARNYPALRQHLPFKNADKELTTANLQMDQLAQETRKAAPEFYNARIRKTYADEIGTVQKRLTDNSTAIVSYFLNIDYDFNREAYILVVQNNRTDFLRAPLPFDYEAKVDSLVQAITTSDVAVYGKLAGKFYQALVQPASGVIGKEVKKLMIMPDGKLWQIPFETLLTKNTNTTDYRKLPYLLRQYHISYQHSATLNTLGKEIAELQDQKFDKTILALAPFADKNLAGAISTGKINLMSGEGNLGNYAKLPYTIKLMQKLQEKTAGLFLIDKEATEDNFKAHAGSYSIIHLATHAETDMANPLNSKFLMAEGSHEDGELYMSELLGMNVKPNLAVLSACETGRGMIDTKSEGMTSLSWSFYYLGCPSTVSTLWKVDDRHTSTVLTGFYDYLFAGKTKQEALQHAKMDFISKARTSEEANPFYWSGLVLTGDAGAMPLIQPPFWQRTWFILSAVLLLAGIAFLYWKKEARTKVKHRQVA